MKARAQGLDTSFLEAITNSHKQGEVAMLRRNYRSHASLLDLPSRMFYGASLLPCADALAVRPPPWSRLQEADEEGAILPESQGIDAEDLLDGRNMLFFGVRGEQV